MSTSPISKYIGLLALVPFFLALFVYNPDVSGYWLDTFFNWLHIPLFALVTISLYFWTDSGQSRKQRARITATAAFALAVASEAVQIPIARDASMLDIISDGVGIAVGLLAVPVYATKRLPPAWSRLIAIAILLLSAMPVIVATVLYTERNRIFPLIANGEWPTHSAFVSRHERGVRFRNLVRDWSGYQTLHVDLSIRHDAPLAVIVRVHDTMHRLSGQAHDDRFNRSFLLPPGDSALTIPLHEIREAPQSRQIDLQQIDGLTVYVNRRAGSKYFEIGGIRLSE